MGESEGALMGWGGRWRAFQEYWGLGRSLAIYYGIPFQDLALARLYGQFIRPGDLCFDLGAHLGSRVRLWSRLGARVVAVEPQPRCMGLLRRWYGRRPGVVLLEAAVGAAPGTMALLVSRRNPTVSTLSSDWQARVQQTAGFAGVRWDGEVPVRVTTLDALIAEHGAPAFCKIDVEGGEGAVLAGLSQALPALSFEYLPATADLAAACIGRLSQLGAYEYNWTVSEWPWLRGRRWLGGGEMARLLLGMPRGASAGDVYARLVAREGAIRS